MTEKEERKQKDHTDSISSDDHLDEALDADQQKAFESIMAQIESGESGNSGAEPEAQPDEPEIPETEEDFAAELEKVTQEAEAAVNSPPAEQGGEEDLDEDQRKAFESIMAQIESGDSDDADEEVKEPVKEVEIPETEEDFAAELEKVTQEAEAAVNSPPAEQSGEEDLDEDQQKAFESIMAQIESGDSDDADEETKEPAKEVEVPETEEDFAAELEKVTQEAEAAVDLSSKESADDQSREETDDGDDVEDISEDINDLLQGIASEGKPSEPEKKDLSDPPDADDDIVAVEIAKPGTVEKNDGDQPFVIDSTQSEVLKKETVTGSPKVEPVGGQKPELAEKTDISIHPLKEEAKPKKRWKKFVFAVMVLALLYFAMAGSYYWWLNQKGETADPTDISDNQDPVEEKEIMVASANPEPMIHDYGRDDIVRLGAAAASLSHLREEMMEKQRELEELRDYYRTGIDSEIQGIVDIVHETGYKKISFAKAMADPRIRLGMDAVIRRHTYIKRLKSPVYTLSVMSEELLFWSRKAEVLTMMAEKTSDIDIDSFIEQTSDICKRLSHDLNQLNIDADVAAPTTAELIWRDVSKRLKQKKSASYRQTSVRTGDNSALWKEICEGDFSNKDRLTDLSPNAARCLAKWEGRDLYLNGLTRLSPEAAGHLAEWKGKWLGLNGLIELKPKTAERLAQWNGKVLSLNGLTRLSPKVVDILSQWRGEQIELINVQHMAHWENPNTRLFLSEDLQRKHLAKRE